MHAVPDPTPCSGVLTFDEAVRMGHEVTDELSNGPPGHGVVVADRDDQIVARAVLEGSFSVDHAVGWALGLHYAAGSSTALVISALPSCVQCLDPLLLWEYERMRRMLETLDLELRDWVVDDGCATRSMAYTASPDTAWLTEPAPRRRDRLTRVDPGLICGGSDHGG